MGPTGRLVTIKRSGVDGPHFPLSLSTCLFGRGIECDIRIQLPVVSKQHCKIEISGQKATLFNFSATNPTQVNGSVIDEPVQLKHGDLITIVDRSFRYENESHQKGSKTTEFPGQRREQASPCRGPRSDFSSDPDGDVQDPSARSEVAEEGVSGPVPTGRGGAARGTPRASGEPIARKTPDVPSSALPGDDGRNSAGPPAGEHREDSSATSASGSGELTCPSPRCPEKRGENESPFRQLYECLKEELDVKSEKENVLQSRRKSGSRSHRTADNGSAGGSQGTAQPRVSPKPGRRSGPRPHSEAGSASGDRGRGRMEAGRTDAGPAHTPRDAAGPRVAPRELTKGESPAPCPQQHSRPGPGGDRTRGGDSVSPGPRVSLGAGGGPSAPERILTRTQTQTATRDDSADKFGNTPEKALPKKRRSGVPTDADLLAVDAETQAQAPLSPLRTQVERKVLDEPLGAGPPGLQSADVSNFPEAVHKMEGVPSKRRRVSFGGHLRPELFDENLPPNTPLKRGETPTKRRSLGTHTPAVLKKIIKEQPPPSGKDDASEIPSGTPAQNALPSLPARTPTGPAVAHTHGARPPPSGPPCTQGTDLPRSGGRRSSGRPPRPSVGRSQLELLQAIHSKRRSGASEANLMVAKSWADVVRLSAKQAQTKVAKRGAQRPPSKRQRRSSAPKVQKPVGGVHHPSSTGHANSPCTIVVGKAHLEKVNAPARPCRMLNSYVFSRKIDFNEDLSGLTEMFKTPAKEKLQMPSIRPTTFSNSEDLLRKTFAVPNSEEETLLHTAKHSGETVFPGTRNAPGEPSDKTSASPAFRLQRFIVTGDVGRARPRAEPLRAASGADGLGRSAELGNTQTPGAAGGPEVSEADAVEATRGRRLGKTPLREQTAEGELTESEGATQKCRKNDRLEENSEKAAGARRSRASELRRAVRPEDPLALWRLQGTDPEGARDGRGAPRSPVRAKEPGDTESRTATAGSKPPEPEPLGTPARANIRIRTPSREASVGVLSAHRERPRTPGESTNTRGDPEGGEKEVKASVETPEQKRDPAENAAGSRRRSRTPQRKVQALEDLAGFTELFQTPKPTVGPVTDDKTKILCRSPQPEPINTSTGRKSRLKTPIEKVDVEEEPSAPRKPAPTPGGATGLHGEPSDGKEIRVFKTTPEQKLGPAENAARSRRRSRTPKRKVQALEDLAGFTELFQTPKSTAEPVTDDKTHNVPCRSPQVDPVITSTIMAKGLKTLLQKVDVEEALLALRKSPRAPGGTAGAPREPAGDEKVIEFFQAIPEQKLDPAENAAGSKRRSRTPKRKVQALDDLAGFTELFQTPKPTVGPVTDDKTKIACRSPQAEPVTMPTGRRCRLKTSFGKVDTEEDISAPRNPTPTPGDTTQSHREARGDDKGINNLNQIPEQKLDPAENTARSRRRSRTPQRKIQALEDLAGFRELFQTPKPTVGPVTDDKTKILCRSPQPEPINTSTGRKSRLKTPIEKVDVEEEPSAPRKPAPTPGGATGLHGEPSDGKEIRVFKTTPEQKLGPAENAARSKRRSRTPMRKVQALEDLAGFTELFQTPKSTVEPVTDDKTKITCKSPQAEPVVTSTIMTRWLKTPPCKVDVEEALLALRKSPRAPGGTAGAPREPAGDEEVIEFFQATPEQKLDPAENAARSRRRSRTPMRKVQALEDLAGFRELFQTPKSTVEPVTDDKTKIACRSPQAEPVTMPTGRRSRLKTSFGKVDMEEDISALRNPTPTPGDTTQSHREAGGDDKDINNLNQIPEQKLDPAENAAGSRRRSRTPKRKVQALEDLAGFTELFQTPKSTVGPVTDDKTHNVPCRSPQVDPVITSAIMAKGLKTLLQKVDVEEALLALRKSPRAPGGTAGAPREPAGDEKVIEFFQAIPEQKLDPAENAAGSKRRSRTPKRKVQALDDLAGFTELFQTPKPTVGPVTDDKTKIACRSPQAEPVTMPTGRRRRLKTSFGKVDTEEDISAPRNPTPTPGDTTQSHREARGDDKDINNLNQIPEQKLDPAENAARSRRRSRTPMRKVQALEDLAGFRELFQTPKSTVEPVTDDKTKIACRSPQAEPVTMPTGRRSRLKTSFGKVDTEEDISALRNPTPTPGDTTQSHREAGGDDKDINNLNQIPEQKLDPAENAARSRRRSRMPQRKVQALEDLAGFTELFQTPKPTVGPVTDDKTHNVPCRSPQPEPINTSTGRKSRLKTPVEKVDVEEEPSAPRKPTPTPGGATGLHGEPGDGKDIGAFTATPDLKPELAEIVIGSKKRPGMPKGKVQALEDLAGIAELFRTPDRTVTPVTDDKAQIACRSPQAEPAGRKKRLKAPPGKADAEVEPSALKKLSRTSRKTTSSHREPKGDDEDIKLCKKTSEQKVDSAETVTRSKRRPRAPKEMARALGDVAGLREPFPASEHADGQSARTLRQSSRPDLRILAASEKRQRKAPTGKEDVEEPAAPGKPTRTPGKTSRSRRAPAGGSKHAGVSQGAEGQRPGPAEIAVGSRRRLRARAGQPSPPEDQPGGHEPIAAPGPDRAPGSDAESAQRDPAPTRGRRKPAQTSRRVPRALRGESTEDPAGSRSESVPRSPMRKRGEDENPAGAKRLRPRACPQDAAESPPLQKRQRTAPRESRPAPGPAVSETTSQRLSAERADLPGSTVSAKSKRRQVEDVAPAEKGMSLRSRRPNKTSGAEQGPGITSAEKAPTRRNEKKTPNASQETNLQNLEDRAENPAPGGQAQGGGARPRPGRQRRAPPGAAGDAAESRPALHGDARGEKEGAKRSGRGCSRPRKVAAPPAGDTSENEPKRRVTRSAKRSAENLTKETDSVCIRKIRTRSRRDSEDI